MPATAEQPLSGLRVLVTRPAPQAAALVERLTRAGASVIAAPLLGIVALPASPEQDALLAGMDGCDTVVVTSRNAAATAFARVAAGGLRLPQDAQWFAVGRATATELGRHGIVATAPEDARSEGLLALPGLADMTGRSALLLTGEGGRGLIEETLAARGARVSRLALYRRVAAAGIDGALDSFAAADPGAPRRAALVTSLEAMQNLVAQAPWIAAGDVVLVTASARIADAARAAGVRRVADAGGADDDSVLAALARLAAQTRE